MVLDLTFDLGALGETKSNVKSTTLARASRRDLVMDRLRQRADFLAVANGARVSAAAFVLQSRRRDDGGPIRVGFTVTRKNGTATERNRIRRRLRELVKRLDAISLRPHSDYVLVGRRAALTRDFSSMLEELRAALHRLNRQASKAAMRTPNE